MIQVMVNNVKRLLGITIDSAEYRAGRYILSAIGPNLLRFAMFLAFLFIMGHTEDSVGMGETARSHGDS